MTCHAAAGNWRDAAVAAHAAVLVSGGLADLGGDTLRDAHAAISARAAEVVGCAVATGAIATGADLAESQN
jgi:hypothetical protein